MINIEKSLLTKCNIHITILQYQKKMFYKDKVMKQTYV